MALVYQVLSKSELLEKIKSRKKLTNTTLIECIEDNGNPSNEDTTLKKHTKKRSLENDLETNVQKTPKKRKTLQNPSNHTIENTDSIQHNESIETLEQTDLTISDRLPSLISSLMQEIIHIPTALNATTETSALNLPPFLLTALRNNSISSLFPVQSSLLPSLLSYPPPPLFYDPSLPLPSDLCVSAPTGSGKTLCYMLPVLARLSIRVVPRLRALVVLPTRDLANQVHSVFAEYTRKSHLKVHLLTRDISMLYNQVSPDVIICTPGRLVDALKSESGITLQHLEFLVVDEADRLLDQSYHEWIPFVTSHLPSGNGSSHTHCRKLLFSATLTMKPEQLSQLKLYRPILYTIADSISTRKYTLPPGLNQFIYTCDSTQDKLTLLYYVLKHVSISSTLCFTNSKDITSKLYLFLSKLGFNVSEFSSQLSDKQRRAVFNKFSKNQIDILICTDTMARGIDIQNVRNVINYDCPPFLRNYVHRVGRTARAHQEGNAHTLLEQCQVYHFKKMIKETNSKFKVKRFNSFQLLPYKDICSTALAQIREEMD